MTDTDHRSQDQPGFGIPEEEYARITTALLEQGQSVGDFLGLAGEELETIYGVAHHSYDGGGYAQAEKMFGLLCLLDATRFRYWLGLGNSRQMLGRHDEALAAYLMAALQDEQDPRPHLQSAVSLIALGERDAAGDALSDALARSGAGQADAALVRERATTLRQWLEAPPEPATAGAKG